MRTMQLLDIDTITCGCYTTDFNGLTHLEKEQVRLSGISEALTIRTIQSGQYEIVGNPKSWYLAQFMQIAQVPVLFVDHLKTDELDTIKKSITQKVEIIDWAEKIAGLSLETTSLAELGRRQGLSRSTVCNLVRIDKMPFEIKEIIRKYPKLVRLGHAKVLAGLSGLQQKSLLNQILQFSLSVHEAERRAKNESPAVTIEKDPDTIKVEDRLTEILGCITTIDIEKGRLIINYGKNNDVLQGLLDRFGYREF